MFINKEKITRAGFEPATSDLLVVHYMIFIWMS